MQQGTQPVAAAGDDENDHDDDGDEEIPHEETAPTEPAQPASKEIPHEETALAVFEETVPLSVISEAAKCCLSAAGEERK